MQQSDQSLILSIDREREPNSKLTLVELVVDGSQVLAPSDRRTWRVVGTEATGVRRVTLGEVPEGWTEEIGWTVPKAEDDLTVRLEFSDGREFLVDVTFPVAPSTTAP